MGKDKTDTRFVEMLLKINKNTRGVKRFCNLDDMPWFRRSIEVQQNWTCSVQRCLKLLNYVASSAIRHFCGGKQMEELTLCSLSLWCVSFGTFVPCIQTQTKTPSSSG